MVTGENIFEMDGGGSDIALCGWCSKREGDTGVGFGVTSLLRLFVGGSAVALSYWRPELLVGLVSKYNKNTL